ncbi:STAS domain protein [Tepidimonas thermarum]|uniref:STAS domain protein n=1 Tax=Tepidimonas thermarum TaxID=335431 RepID=A0A554X883_9BURK|nr:STAS domain-containing protein [Tepidimonas thermarum]TSE32034.1 STAS domain protein [Tepidimonas thermarum]
MNTRPDAPTPSGWWERVWRRLHARAPGEDRVSGLDEERRALKAAIQRKRRNDRVRHQELNELRALMRAGQAGTATAPDSRISAGGWAAGRSGWRRPGQDQARTIEQIARIEAQMAQHWVPRAAPAQGLRIGAPVPERAGPIVSGHLQAPAPGFGMSIDVVGVESGALAAEREALLGHPVLTEAAVSFANGRLEAAHQALEALLAQEGRTPLAHWAGQVLLDLLWAAGDVEAFEDWGAEWADRFRLPVPRWPVVLPPPAPAPLEPAPAWRVWRCPARLDTAAVAALAALAEPPEAAVWLDWSDLQAADAAAAEWLAALCEGWAQQPRTLRWRAAAVLRRRLKASTPSGRAENPRVWWRLRLAVLHLMGRRDEFDLVALDYCVTYGDPPPDWRAPLACVETAEVLPAPGAAPDPGPEDHPTQDTARAGGGADGDADGDAVDAFAAWPAAATAVAAGESDFPAVSTLLADWAASTTPAAAPAVRLEGALLGEPAQALEALEAALAAAGPAPDGGTARTGAEGAGAAPLVVDVRRLQRVDFAAAGALLQWLLGARGRGVRVELDGVGPLLATVFHVVGIDDAATLRLRQY